MLQSPEAARQTATQLFARLVERLSTQGHSRRTVYYSEGGRVHDCTVHSFTSLLAIFQRSLQVEYPNQPSQSNSNNPPNGGSDTDRPRIVVSEVRLTAAQTRSSLNGKQGSTANSRTLAERSSRYVFRHSILHVYC